MLATPTTAVMCPAYVTPRVRELPRRLEPVTRDPFGELGDGRGLPARLLGEDRVELLQLAADAAADLVA
jgi:hypothetical protein